MYYCSSSFPVVAKFTFFDSWGVVIQVASALMKHATDMAFDENAPVPENLADLAKAAEDEMKIDAEVMQSRR